MQPTEKIKYIEGKPSLGILVDWKKVKRAYKKLKCPPETYNPIQMDVTKYGYIMDLSDRSRGKTTNKLLVGLILYKMYGIQLQYIRQTKADVENRMLKDLYDTVLYHHYIEKIFEGEFNSIYYRGKRWYLSLVDEEGKIVAKDDTHCTFCIGLNESDNLKSTYNAPTGDMIFFDEFITSRPNPNDFVLFTDICKTIIRDRISPVIFLSANTINKNSQYFDEFNIRSYVENLQAGESAAVISPEGTHIYITILPMNTTPERKKVNERYFGFDNPKLASITGKGTWATEHFQHIPEGDVKILFNNIYIYHIGKYIKLRIVHHEYLGVCVYCYPSHVENLHDDSVIFTLSDMTDRRYIFAFGLKGIPVCNIWYYYTSNKFYYLDNSIGGLVKDYIVTSRRTIANRK